jgi:hypothetical protein
MQQDPHYHTKKKKFIIYSVLACAVVVALWIISLLR